MAKDYLIIDRSKWRTGGDHNFFKSIQSMTGKGDTQLLNDQGFMCCLGFRCHQMGVPKKELLNMATPDCLNDWDIPDLLTTSPLGTVIDSKFTTEAIRINDNPDISSKEREKQIKEHFATIGVTVEFTGKYKKA